MENRLKLFKYCFLILIINFFSIAFADGLVYYYEENKKVKELSLYDQIALVEFDDKTQTEKMIIVNDLWKSKVKINRLGFYINNKTLFFYEGIIPPIVPLQRYVPESELKLIEDIVKYYLKNSSRKINNIVWIIPIETSDPKKVKLKILEKEIGIENFTSAKELYKKYEDTLRKKLEYFLDPFEIIEEGIDRKFLRIGAALTKHYQEEKIKVFTKVSKFGIEFQFISAKNASSLLSYTSKFGKLPPNIKEKLSKYFGKKNFYFIIGYIKNHSQIPVVCKNLYFFRRGSLREKGYICSKRINLQVEFPTKTAFYPLFLTGIYNTTNIVIYVNKFVSADPSIPHREFGFVDSKPYTKFTLSSKEIKDDVYFKEDEIKYFWLSILESIGKNENLIFILMFVIFIGIFIKIRNEKIEKYSFFIGNGFLVIYGITGALILLSLFFHNVDFWPILIYEWDISHVSYETGYSLDLMINALIIIVSILVVGIMLGLVKRYLKSNENIEILLKEYKMFIILLGKSIISYFLSCFVVFCILKILWLVFSL